jgi:hypothetical protein
MVERFHTTHKCKKRKVTNFKAGIFSHVYTNLLQFVVPDTEITKRYSFFAALGEAWACYLSQ